MQAGKMKIMIVFSGNSVTDVSHYTYIYEQAESLKSLGINVDYFSILGKGIKGYLNNYKPLLHSIKKNNPDIIHAHSGLAGLLANLQRKVPVVTTYHGTDINSQIGWRYSKWSVKLSAHNIFVSKNIMKIAQLNVNCSLLPCGVDLKEFIIINKLKARQQLGYNNNEKLVLFAGAFDSPLKNVELAKAAIRKLDNVKLIELKGYTRKEVNLLMCAVDVAIMTSFSEGSPQFIKEAMACECPIVSVNVGDVENIVNKTDGCYICEYDPNDLANKLESAILSGEHTDGRKRLTELGLDSETISKKLMAIYSNLIAVRGKSFNNKGRD